MKQTAVDYIKEKLQGYGFDFGYVLDVAKEMEKEQIVNAYNDCEWTGDHEDGEQYYKETYNKQEQ